MIRSDSYVPLELSVAILLLLVLVIGCSGKGEVSDIMILEGDGIQFSLCKKTGMIVGGGTLGEGEDRLLTQSLDAYRVDNVLGTQTKTSDESLDKVILDPIVSEDSESVAVTFVCENSSLKGIIIKKTYALSKRSTILSKKVAFESSLDDAVFLVYSTSMALDSTFRKTAYYNALTLAASDTIADLVPTDSIRVRERKEANPGNEYWNMQPKIVTAVNLAKGYGIGQYRHKINDHYVFINVYKSDIPRLYYTSTGWDMGVSVTRLDPGCEVSAETHINIFQGDQLSFYKQYFDLPEVQHLRQPDSRAPEWLQNYLGEDVHWWVPFMPASQARVALLNLVDSEVISEETNVGVMCWGWYRYRGDEYPEGTYDAFGKEVDMEWMADEIGKMKMVAPNAKIGVYSWWLWLDEESEAVSQHPDWLVRDKHGLAVEKCLADDNKTVSGLTNLTEEVKEYVLHAYRGMLDKFDLDFIYLDGGMLGHSKIDWATKQVIQEYEWYDLYERMRDLAREFGAAVHNNYPGSFYADMSYSEFPDLSKVSWRTIGAGLYISKLYEPENAFRILIYPNDTRYYDYVIGLGCRPLTTQGYAYRLAEAAFEVKDMEPAVDIDFTPAWWRSEDVLLEAYPLVQGNAGIISFINRDRPGSNAEFSVNLDKFGLDVSKDLFVWRFIREDYEKDEVKAGFQMPHHVWKAAIEKGEAPLAMNRAFLGHYKTSDTVMSFDIEPPNRRLNMLMLTNSPAVLASIDGIPTHFNLPTSMGVELSGRILWEQHRVVVDFDSVQNAYRILVFVPREWTVVKVIVGDNVVEHGDMIIDGQQFIEVALEKGQGTLEIYAK